MVVFLVPWFLVPVCPTLSVSSVFLTIKPHFADAMFYGAEQTRRDYISGKVQGIYKFRKIRGK
jgi:hypothetical protein